MLSDRKFLDRRKEGRGELTLVFMMQAHASPETSHGMENPHPGTLYQVLVYTMNKCLSIENRPSCSQYSLSWSIHTLLTSNRACLFFWGGVRAFFFCFSARRQVSDELGVEGKVVAEGRLECSGDFVVEVGGSMPTSLGLVGLGWVGLGWVEFGLVGLAWVGLG